MSAQKFGKVLLFLTAVLSADTKTQSLNVKLGLWEIKYTYQSANATSVRPELLAKMTPAQRARTQARLKERAQQSPRVETKQFCMTQDKLNTAAFEQETSRACKRTIITANMKLQEFRDECGQGSAKSTIESRIEAMDPNNLRGSFQVKGPDGESLGSSIDVSGKWLSSACKRDE